MICINVMTARLRNTLACRRRVERDPGKCARLRTAWRLNNLGRVNAANRKWTGAHPEQVRAIQRKNLYGEGAPEHLARQLAQQDGRCAICRRVFNTEPHLDHKHLTHQLRGALCRGCNLLIQNEDAALLESAARYLRYWHDIGSLGSQSEEFLSHYQSEVF